MLAYNIWRSFKMMAERSHTGHGESKEPVGCPLKGIADNTIRIARLKLLFIAAKIVSHSDTSKVRYSEHDSRVAGLFGFYEYLDNLRQKIRPWLQGSKWQCRHMERLQPRPMALCS